LQSTSGRGRERATTKSSLRFSSFRRRFSRPLLIVYTRQKPFHDNDDDDDDEHDDTLQNVDPLKDAQTTWKEAISKVARRQKNMNGGKVGMRVDRKKNRKTATTVGTTTQQPVEESTEPEVTSSHQRITTHHQNSLTAGGMNQRSSDASERNYKQENSSTTTTTAAATTPFQVTLQNRMAIPDAANALRRRRRSKRGVLDNEIDIPDDDIRQPHHRGTAAGYVDRPRISPILLQGRKSRQKVASTAESIYTKHEDNERLPDSVFDLGNRRNEKARTKRRNNRVRGWRRKQTSLMTLLRNPDDHGFSDRQRSTAADATCKKKQLQVNFADIGWGEWIIAPDFFDAFYCDGSCSFPIARVSNTCIGSIDWLVI